jgi:hypothetical protein
MAVKCRWATRVVLSKNGKAIDLFLIFFAGAEGLQ